MNAEYEVWYEAEIVDVNKNVESKGCTSISFTNSGSDDATILNNIPLASASKDSISFDNLPDTIISKDFQFNIIFATTTAPKVYIVRTYVRKRK